MKNINYTSGKGKCFESTSEYTLRYCRETEDYRGDFEVCHGYVTGTGGKVVGVTYPHAWIERTYKYNDRPLVLCYDETHNLGPLPAELYYKAGDIDPETVIRYELDQVVELCLKHGHYGPWHIGGEQ